MADKASSFWLPQAAVEVSTSDAGLALPWKAALQTLSFVRGHLIGVPWSTIADGGTKQHFSTKVLNYEFLVKIACVLKTSTCYVFGTCSFERAVKLSWDAYGLNLFDLPWDKNTPEPNTKAIRYVPLLSLADLLRETDRHARIQECVPQSRRRAVREIGWARCRIRLRDLGKHAYHGERDILQVGETSTQAHDIPNFSCRCPARDKYECPIPEMRESLAQIAKDPKSGWWPVRELANLDCQARMFAPLAAGKDLAIRGVLPMASYRRVVIVEDNTAVRQDIGQRFLMKYDSDPMSARLFEDSIFEPPPGSFGNDPVVLSLPPWLRDEFRKRGVSLPVTMVLFSVPTDKNNNRDAPLWRVRPDFVACWLHERNKSPRPTAWLLQPSDAGPKREDQEHPPDQDKDKKMWSVRPTAWLLLDGDTNSNRDDHDQEYLLVQDEGKTSWSVYRQPLAFADPDKTIKTGVPTRADGTKINVPAVHDHCPGAGTLFCFDLELRSQAESRDSDQTPDGVRVLYKAALEFPYSSRVVVTGYRHQDHVAFNAGTGTFLLKPFTDHEFDKAVEHALPFRAVWVCPEKVRENWRRYWPTANGGESGDAIFESHIRAPLHDWAAERGVFLAKPVEDTNAAAVQTASIVFLDLFEMPDGADWPDAKKLADELRDELVEVKTANPSAQVVTLLPMTDAIFVNGGALETQGRLARDGQDFVAFKPLPLFTDCPSVPSIGQSLLSALAARPRFDVKYVAITPLMGLVWAKCKDFLKACEHGSNDPKDWGPFVVLVGQIWGMQIPVRSLTGNPNLGLDLLEEFERERENNRQRWQGRPSSPVDSCRRFVEFLRRFDEYWTAETWLFSILNEKSFTEELDRLFGGETRLGLGTRGAWYDGSQRVEDPNLVVEFCGRRGIIGREAIRKWVVNYLKGQGAEQVVLFHEVPMRGYLE